MLTGDLPQTGPQLGLGIGNGPRRRAVGRAVLTYEATGSAFGDPEASLQGGDRPTATLRGQKFPVKIA
jgi:hypothetical protein